MSVTSEGLQTASPPESAAGRGSPAPRRITALRAHYLAGLLSVAGGLCLWELISRFLVANALFLAAPSQIAVAIYNLAATGELWHHIGVSAAEFALGYVIASVLGIALGLGMASSATMNRRCSPGSRASTPRRPSRWRRCSFCGSASASGRK